MSLVSMIGPRPNLLGHQAGTHKRLEVSQPILTNEDLEKIRVDPRDARRRLPHHHPRRDLAEGRRRPVARGGAAAPVLGSDRGGARRHQRADPVGPRRRAGSDPDPGRAGDRRGPPPSHPPGPADADRPGRSRPARRARSTISACSPAMAPRRSIPGSPSTRIAALTRRPRGAPQANYIKAIGKGMLKVMSKMGISTYQSYCGAQIFDAVGLGQLRSSTNISPAPRRRSRASALPSSPRRCARRHRTALPPATSTASTSAASTPSASAARSMPGPSTAIANLQHAVRGNLPDKYRAFADELNAQSRAAADHARPARLQAGRPGRAARRGRAGERRSSGASPPAR